MAKRRLNPGENPEDIEDNQISFDCYNKDEPVYHEVYDIPEVEELLETPNRWKPLSLGEGNKRKVEYQQEQASNQEIQELLDQRAKEIKQREGWDDITTYSLGRLKREHPYLINSVLRQDGSPFYSVAGNVSGYEPYLFYEVRKKGEWTVVVRVAVGIELSNKTIRINGVQSEIFFEKQFIYLFHPTPILDMFVEEHNINLGNILEDILKAPKEEIGNGEKWFYNLIKDQPTLTLLKLAISVKIREPNYLNLLNSIQNITSYKLQDGFDLVTNLPPLEENEIDEKIPIQRQQSIILTVLSDKPPLSGEGILKDSIESSEKHHKKEGEELRGRLNNAKLSYDKILKILSNLDQKENRQKVVKASSHFNLDESDFIGAELLETSREILEGQYGIKAYPISIIVPSRNWQKIVDRNPDHLRTADGVCLNDTRSFFAVLGGIKIIQDTESKVMAAMHEDLHGVFDIYNFEKKIQDRKLLTELFAYQIDIDEDNRTWDDIAEILMGDAYKIDQYQAFHACRTMEYLDEVYPKSRPAVSHILLNCRNAQDLFAWANEPFMEALRSLSSNKNTLQNFCDKLVNNTVYDLTTDDFKNVYLSKEDIGKLERGNDFSCSITILIPSEDWEIIGKKLSEAGKSSQVTTFLNSKSNQFPPPINIITKIEMMEGKTRSEEHLTVQITNPPANSPNENAVFMKIEGSTITCRAQVSNHEPGNIGWHWKIDNGEETVNTSTPQQNDFPIQIDSIEPGEYTVSVYAKQQAHVSEPATRTITIVDLKDITATIKGTQIKTGDEFNSGVTINFESALEGGERAFNQFEHKWKILYNLNRLYDKDGNTPTEETWETVANTNLNLKAKFNNPGTYTISIAIRKTNDHTQTTDKQFRVRIKQKEPIGSVQQAIQKIIQTMEGYEPYSFSRTDDGRFDIIGSELPISHFNYNGDRILVQALFLRGRKELSIKGVTNEGELLQVEDVTKRSDVWVWVVKGSENIAIEQERFRSIGVTPYNEGGHDELKFVVDSKENIPDESKKDRDITKKQTVKMVTVLNVAVAVSEDYSMTTGEEMGFINYFSPKGKDELTDDILNDMIIQIAENIDENVLNPRLHPTLEEIEERLKPGKNSKEPGRYSEDGFMAEDERLWNIIDTDIAILKRLGVTHEQIADKLHYLFEKAKESDVTVDGKFRVEHTQSRGPQVCPWGILDSWHEYKTGSKEAKRYDKEPQNFGYLGNKYDVAGTRDCTITNTTNGESIGLSNMAPHLIGDHHFFEGSTPYRMDPEKLVRVLDIKPSTPPTTTPTIQVTVAPPKAQLDQGGVLLGTPVTINLKISNKEGLFMLRRARINLATGQQETNPEVVKNITIDPGKEYNEPFTDDYPAPGKYEDIFELYKDGAYTPTSKPFLQRSVKVKINPKPKKQPSEVWSAAFAMAIDLVDDPHNMLELVFQLSIEFYHYLYSNVNIKDHFKEGSKLISLPAEEQQERINQNPKFAQHWQVIAVLYNEKSPTVRINNLTDPKDDRFGTKHNLRPISYAICDTKRVNDPMKAKRAAFVQHIDTEYTPLKREIPYVLKEYNEVMAFVNSELGRGEAPAEPEPIAKTSDPKQLARELFNRVGFFIEAHGTERPGEYQKYHHALRNITDEFAPLDYEGGALIDRLTIIRSQPGIPSDFIDPGAHPGEGLLYPKANQIVAYKSIPAGKAMDLGERKGLSLDLSKILTNCSQPHGVGIVYYVFVRTKFTPGDLEGRGIVPSKCYIICNPDDLKTIMEFARDHTDKFHDFVYELAGNFPKKDPIFSHNQGGKFMAFNSSPLGKQVKLIFEKQLKKGLSGNKVYFIGIGGIGMSAAARIVKSQRKEVLGSDSNESEITKQLQEEGIPVSIPQKAENVPRDADLAVHTVAVPDTNPERQQVKALVIPELTYPELLGQLMKDKYAIGVSGTNGKTTTTAMVSSIFIKANKDPTIVLGSRVDFLNDTNSRVGKSKYFIFESCEYRCAFHNYNPKMAAVTYIEREHLDCFPGGLPQIIQAFHDYLSRVPNDGYIFINADDPHSLQAAQGCSANIVTFGIDSDAHIQAKNIQVQQGKGQTFDLHFDNKKLGQIGLSLPAKYNVYNVLAAFGPAHYSEIPFETIQETISDFQGTEGRFQELGKVGKTTIIADYAHEPGAVKQTIEATNDYYPNNEILFVFQPHSYHRTKTRIEDFGKSFNAANNVRIMDIHEVKGRDKAEDKDITTQDVIDEINKHQNNAQHANEEDLIQTVRNQEFDYMIMMGAGVISTIAKRLVSSGGSSPPPTSDLGEGFLRANSANIIFSWKNNLNHRDDPKYRPDVDKLKELKLWPVAKKDFKGNTYYVSKAYKYHLRTGMVLYFYNGDGKFYARTVYKSNSNSVWRTISHYYAGWFGKGRETEESVTYPHELQPFFENVARTEPITLEEDTAKGVIAGLATHKPEPGMSFVGTISKEDETQERPIVDIGEFTGEEPESYKFKRGYNPDWTTLQEPYPTYNQIIDKDTQTYICKSKNKKASFLFYLDPDNRAWIGSIQLTQFKPNSYGTNINVISKESFELRAGREVTNNLLTPANEYWKQIPQIPREELKEVNHSYYDASSYVESLNIIKELKRKIRPIIPSQKLKDVWSKSFKMAINLENDRYDMADLVFRLSIDFYEYLYFNLQEEKHIGKKQLIDGLAEEQADIINKNQNFSQYWQVKVVGYNTTLSDDEISYRPGIKPPNKNFEPILRPLSFAIHPTTTNDRPWIKAFVEPIDTEYKPLEEVVNKKIFGTYNEVMAFIRANLG